MLQITSEAASEQRADSRPTSVATAAATESRPLRIAHLSLTLCTGGLERLLVEFARHRDPARFDVQFLAMNGLGRPADDIQAAGCRVTDLNFAHVSHWNRVRLLAAFLKEQQIDLLHTHNSAPHLHGTLAARLASIPVLHTRHGRRFERSLSERWQFRLMSRLADRIVGVSEDTLTLCRQVGRLRPGAAQKIWNGIDELQFPYASPSTAHTLVSVGRLAPEKGYFELIEACRAVRNQVPDFRMILVGDGPLKTELSESIKALGLQDCVELAGEQSDVLAQLRRGCAYVCSSHTEGLSLTILEAMSSGLPVVATDVGGNSEVVEHGVTGILVPPGDTRELAAGMLRVLDDPELREEFSLLARERVERYFAIRNTVSRYESLYDELAASRRNP